MADEVDTSHPTSKTQDPEAGVKAEQQPLNEGQTISLAKRTMLAKIRQARENSANNHVGFFGDLLALIIGSMASIAALFILNIIPISMFVIGFLFVGKCPNRPGIPIWLMMNGAIILIQCWFENITRWVLAGSTSTQEERNTKRKILYWISLALRLLSIVSFIALCISVYAANWPTFDDTASPEYCSPTLYLYSYWLLNITFIFLAFILVIMLLSVFYAFASPNK